MNSIELIYVISKLPVIPMRLEMVPHCLKESSIAPTGRNVPPAGPVGTDFERFEY
jgi:hypothetical protein